MLGNALSLGLSRECWEDDNWYRNFFGNTWNIKFTSLVVNFVVHFWNGCNKTADPQSWNQYWFQDGLVGLLLSSCSKESCRFMSWATRNIFLSLSPNCFRFTKTVSAKCILNYFPSFLWLYLTSYLRSLSGHVSFLVKVICSHFDLLTSIRHSNCQFYILF